MEENEADMRDYRFIVYPGKLTALSVYCVHRGKQGVASGRSFPSHDCSFHFLYSAMDYQFDSKRLISMGKVG